MAENVTHDDGRRDDAAAVATAAQRNPRRVGGSSWHGSRKQAPMATKKSTAKKTPAKKSTAKKTTAKKTTAKKTTAKKNSLVNNINKRKRAGTSRPKSRSTVSKKSYEKMEEGWPHKK